jgi:hypothetical protein
MVDTARFSAGLIPAKNLSPPNQIKIVPILNLKNVIPYLAIHRVRN